MLAARGANGHMVQILDPAEETPPYEGSREFLGLEGGESWIADRAETLRGRYQAAPQGPSRRVASARRAPRLVVPGAPHRIGLRREPLLTLIMRLEGREGQLPLATPRRTETDDDRPPG